METIRTIAGLTFREAIRRKIVLAALILGTAFLLLYGLGFFYIQQEFDASSTRFRPPSAAIRNQAYNVLFLAGMYVVNFLCIATAALITTDSLAGEIQSGTIQAIITKPIRRSEVVLGKWLGHAGLLLLYLLLLGGGVVLVVWIMTRYTATNWLAGLGLVYFNCLVVMSLTLAFSSTLSTLATGGAVFGAYGLAFIGGWVERIGTYLNNQTAANLGILSSLLMPSDAIWSKAGTMMSTRLMNMGGVNPFTSGSEPSSLMIIYSVLYLTLMVGIAIRQFGKRDL
jgi:ABC-type transport system involved in multi-copper enzyme maturation permease subunit